MRHVELSGPSGDSFSFKLCLGGFWWSFAFICTKWDLKVCTVIKKKKNSETLQPSLLWEKFYSYNLQFIKAGSDHNSCDWNKKIRSLSLSTRDGFVDVLYILSSHPARTEKCNSAVRVFIELIKGLKRATTLDSDWTVSPQISLFRNICCCSVKSAESWDFYNLISLLQQTQYFNMRKSSSFLIHPDKYNWFKLM